MSLDEYFTLKLDSAWRPLAIIPAKEALIMGVMEKCNVIETWDKKISSEKHVFELPSVIVLKTYNNKTKRQPKCTRMNIFLRDNHVCQYCGITGVKMTIDHVIPKSKGGGFEWSNLVTCCEKCNQKKGDRTPDKAGMKLLNKPVIPASKLTKIFNPNSIKPEWKYYF